MLKITKSGIRLLCKVLLAYLMLASLLLYLPPHAMAAATPEETLPLEAESPAKTVIPSEAGNEPVLQLKHDSPVYMGWITVQATPPADFSGVILLELQNVETGATETIQLESQYLGGQWLPVGTYTVNCAYALNCDHFQVTCDTKITIVRYGEVYLPLTVTSDETFDTYIEEKRATFTPCLFVSYADELSIWDFLLELTGNPYGAAGIMANLYAESGLCTTNLQNNYEQALGYDDLTYTQAVDEGTYQDFSDDCAGYGLAQWTYFTRKEKLHTYAQDSGKSIGDLELQLNFIAQELTESGLLDALQSADSIREASDLVLVYYEAPLDQSDSVKEIRSGFGEYFYNRFALGTCAEETIVQGQADVIRVATDSGNYEIMEELSCGQQWAAQVYAAAGFPLDSSCCAYHSGIANGVSSDWSQIPPGATVYGYSGSAYGHVGIYVGNGLVYHNNGSVTVDTLTNWVRTYQGFCWGWEAGIDLTQVP